MIEALAVDTSAVADFERETRPTPPQIREAQHIYLPLPVLGELFAGAYLARRHVEANLKSVEDLIEAWTILAPDRETSRIFGMLRGQLGLAKIGQSKRIDLWIAALCLQHDLPLLTSDDKFDHIPNLKVLHWYTPPPGSTSP